VRWLPDRWPRRWLYAATAAVLAAGAPAGLLVVRAVGRGGASPAWAASEIAADAATFAYVTLSTLTAFLAFGYLLGRHADRLLALSRTDPLTGLGNARVLTEKLAEEVERGRRYRRPLSLLLIDVDGLKTINDRGGHVAGDAALVRVAEALRAAARRTDLPARWGGDEFALVAPEATAEAAFNLGERVRTLAGVGADATRPPLTVSVGVATIGGRAHDTVDGLREKADAALYAAKTRGRNCVVAAGDDHASRVKAAGSRSPSAGPS
jgi:diguanylate cyclase (GGDEF)-like protein